MKMRRIEILCVNAETNVKVFRCMLNDRTFKCLKVLKGNGEYSRADTRSKRSDNFWLVSSSVERTEAKLRLFHAKERLCSTRTTNSHCTLKIIVFFQKKFKWIPLSLCRYYKSFAQRSIMSQPNDQTL